MRVPRPLPSPPSTSAPTANCLVTAPRGRLLAPVTFTIRPCERDKKVSYSLHTAAVSSGDFEDGVLMPFLPPFLKSFNQTFILTSTYDKNSTKWNKTGTPTLATLIQHSVRSRSHGSDVRKRAKMHPGW